MTKSSWEDMLFPVRQTMPKGERRRTAYYIASHILEQELSEKQKRVLVLYYKEKKTMPEIAHLLGVNVSTVSRTRRRACEIVRDRLTVYGLLQ